MYSRIINKKMNLIYIILIIIFIGNLSGKDFYKVYNLNMHPVNLLDENNINIIVFVNGLGCKSCYNHVQKAIDYLKDISGDSIKTSALIQSHLEIYEFKLKIMMFKQLLKFDTFLFEPITENESENHENYKGLFDEFQIKYSPAVLMIFNDKIKFINFDFIQENKNIDSVFYTNYKSLKNSSL